MLAPMVSLQESFLAIHRALRRDVTEIDDLACRAVSGGADLVPLVRRLDAFHAMLALHARCEDDLVLPVLERVAPLLAFTYRADHEEDAAMAAAWSGLRARPDALAVARTTAVLKAHVLLHLDKEDRQLYPILHERLGAEEQARILRAMVSEVRPDADAASPESPSMVSWLFPLLDDDDRETIVRWWIRSMPEPVFAETKAAIRQSIADGWTELVKRVPGLA
jgi:hypothetical protein